MMIEKRTAFEGEQRERINSVYWAGVLIWTGLVFGLDRLGILPQVGRADAWSWVFFGSGAYALLVCMHHAASVEQPHLSLWSYVWGVILIILGLSGLTGLKIGFPLILVLIGIALLVSARERR